MTPTARIYADVTGPVATFTARDGHTEPIRTTGAEDIRHAVVRRAATEAKAAGTTLELVTSGDRGEHHLLVAADGTLAPYLDDATPPLRADRTHEPADGIPERPPLPPITARDAATTPALPDTESPGLSGHPSAEATDSGSSELTDVQNPDVPVSDAATARASFIDASPGAGSRSWLTRVFGVKVPPSARQLEHDRQVALVSRQWAGCRTIAIANGKGGVGKTLTTAMLAAVYGRHGGGNVLAWDNNDTRGTLGWRTETGMYDTTIRDLLPATGDLLSPAAGVSDITRYVHHQAADRYDVLRSNPELLAVDQRLTTDDFDQLMQVAARYYRLVVFDSGNDESADRWLRMIDSTHQLVIPTLTAPESAESAALLLDALRGRDDHSRQLVDAAVVIITQSEPSTAADARRIAAGFEGRVRDVRTIPFDPALKSGALRFDYLRPATRAAWLAAAAAVADGL